VRNVMGSALGGDDLIGSSTGGVLVGYTQGNTLIGWSGRNVLIGGYGKNLLLAFGSDDLVIAGSPVFDGRMTALALILAEWQSANSYDARVWHLRYGGGLNGGERLILGTTVAAPTDPPGPRFGFGGGERQSTIVGDGARHWFFTWYASI